MSSAQVYLKAAKTIDVGYVGYACNAISVVRGSEYDMDMFELYFKPKRVPAYRPWFGSSDVPENQECRVIALLFMAAMAAGDL